MTIVKRFQTDKIPTSMVSITSFTTANLPLFRNTELLQMDANGILYVIPSKFMVIYGMLSSMNTVRGIDEYIHFSHSDQQLRMQLSKVLCVTGDITYHRLLDVMIRNNISLDKNISDAKSRIEEVGFEEYIQENTIRYSNPDAIHRKRILIGEQYPRYSDVYAEDYEDGEITVDSNGNNPLMRLHNDWKELDDEGVITFLSPLQEQPVETEQ